MDANRPPNARPCTALFLALLLAGCPESFGPPADAPIAEVEPDWVLITGVSVRESVADLAISGSGDVYVTGTRNVYSDTDASMYVLKTDSAGRRLWSNEYGGPGASEGYAVLAADDGGFLTAGATRSSGAGRFDAFLLKADARGEEQWSRTYGGEGYDFAHGIAPTPDGGYAIAGYTRSFGAGKMDMYLVKTDAEGNELWNQTFGTSRYESAYRVRATRDGGYLLLGFQGDGKFDDYGSFHQIYAVKADAAGRQVWERVLISEEYAVAYDMQETADGGFVIAGDAGYTSFYMKIDAAGNTISSRTPQLYRYATDIRRIAPTSDGGFIMAGAILPDTYEGTYNVFLIKLDGAGNAVWREQVRTSTDTFGFAVAGQADGKFIVAGTEASPEEYYSEDIFVLRAGYP